MKKNYFIIFLSIAAFFLSIASCKKEAGGCAISMVATAQSKYVQRTIRYVDSTIGGLPFDTFYVTERDTILPYLNAINLEIDTIGILGTPNTGFFSFYLNPNELKTSYAIRYDTIGAYIDTIRIYHSSFPVYVSNDCGYTHYFQIDSLKYSSASIDSVFINNYEITLDKTAKSALAYFYFLKEL